MPTVRRHRVSDLAEARAFRRIFGPRGVPVTALKGYMGNLASGCGAVELIASLVGVNRGKIPAILNCDEPDPEMRARRRSSRSPRADRQSDLRQHEPDTQRPGRGARDSGMPTGTDRRADTERTSHRTDGAQIRGRLACGVSW